jgi:hypothetical protein
MEINVAKAFILTDDKGLKIQFTAGLHDVEPAIASHWYVKAHLVDAPAPVVPDGSFEAIQAGKAAKAEAEKKEAKDAATLAQLQAEEEAKRAKELEEKTAAAIAESARLAAEAASGTKAKK